MTVARAYTYLGKTSEGYHIYEGRYTAALADLYSRTDRITLLFPGLQRVLGIIGISGGLADDGNNLGNPVVVLSIAGTPVRTVTLMMLETGAGAGVGLAEKTDGEAYGDAVDIRVTVFGV